MLKRTATRLLPDLSRMVLFLNMRFVIARRVLLVAAEVCIFATGEIRRQFAAWRSLAGIERLTINDDAAADFGRAPSSTRPEIPGISKVIVPGSSETDWQ